MIIVFFPAGIGTITGGIVLYITKLRGKKLALFITIIIAITVPISPAFLINCPSLPVAGITVPYADGLVNCVHLEGGG